MEFGIFIPDKCPTLRIAFSPINPRAPRADLAFSSDIVGSVSLTFLVTTSVAVASWSWKGRRRRRRRRSAIRRRRRAIWRRRRVTRRSERRRRRVKVRATWMRATVTEKGRGNRSGRRRENSRRKTTRIKQEVFLCSGLISHIQQSLPFM